ncbi:unnamed protein product [Ambrosiozyma monospora]|uniref:Unnamed protein product n=1 Tax=Ambrosiozyma monospora TaxID=43982 RepID=A0A9W6Z0W0_AMBMO|nr:unnamed protein product [Ambrosiozyma monospora]
MFNLLITRKSFEITSSRLIRPSLSLVSGRRWFSQTVSTHLIYKSQPKIIKQKSANTDTETKKETVSDIEDHVKNKKLAKNKYYQNTPNFLKPYMKELMLRPMQFTLSFLILHEVTAILPFLGLWSLMIKYDWLTNLISSFDFSQEIFQKGVEILDKGLVNLQVNDAQEKLKIVTAGATSYAFTKALLPVRIPICFALAPYFDKYCVRPIGRILSAVFRRKDAGEPIKPPKSKSE